MSGKKKDKGKAPIHLIPTEAILAMAKGFQYGAKKYGEYNFRQGIEYTRLIDSLMRHTLAFLDGEDIDEESKLSHVDLIGANFAMLKYMEVNAPEKDDRPKKSLGRNSINGLQEAIKLQEIDRLFPNNDNEEDTEYDKQFEADFYGEDDKDDWSDKKYKILKNNHNVTDEFGNNFAPKRSSKLLKKLNKRKKK